MGAPTSSKANGQTTKNTIEQPMRIPRSFFATTPHTNVCVDGRAELLRHSDGYSPVVEDRAELT